MSCSDLRCTLEMVPGNALNVVREQVAHAAVQRMSKVLKYVKLGLPVKVQVEGKQLLYSKVLQVITDG